MTFPEFITADSTWWERMLCKLVGHNICHAAPEKISSPLIKFCFRCGHEPDPAHNRRVESYWRHAMGLEC